MKMSSINRKYSYLFVLYLIHNFQNCDSSPRYVIPTGFHSLRARHHQGLRPISRPYQGLRAEARVQDSSDVSEIRFKSPSIPGLTQPYSAGQKAVTLKTNPQPYSVMAEPINFQNYKYSNPSSYSLTNHPQKYSIASAENSVPALYFDVPANPVASPLASPVSYKPSFLAEGYPPRPTGLQFNPSAVGLLGFLGFLAIMQNVMKQMNKKSMRTTTSEESDSIEVRSYDDIYHRITKAKDNRFRPVPKPSCPEANLKINCTVMNTRFRKRHLKHMRQPLQPSRTGPKLEKRSS